MSEQPKKLYPLSPGITLMEKTQIEKKPGKLTNNELKEKFMQKKNHSPNFMKVNAKIFKFNHILQLVLSG